MTPTTRQLFRFGRRSTLSDSGLMRLDAAPPSLRHAPNSLWQRLLFWLLAPAPHEAAPPLNRLPLVRNDFLAALVDIENEEARGLRHRIGSTRSLRELWHQRAEVFRIIGRAFGQSEAERRVLVLNRHFPVRAARRSQFGGL